jgi:uncharacterized protein
MQKAAWAILAIVALGFGAPRMADADSHVSAQSTTFAAMRGDAGAQTRLGLMYERGIGVPQNYALAAKWYHRAAEQGDVRAQYHLGVLFNKGFGVPTDFLLAYKWLNLAASRAPSADRAYYVRIRDAVATKLSYAELEEAQWWAHIWHPTR